jgi:hypothetical protein
MLFSMPIGGIFSISKDELTLSLVVFLYTLFYEYQVLFVEISFYTNSNNDCDTSDASRDEAHC